MPDDWKRRLVRDLEPILRGVDPRTEISAYSDMPYAIFRYTPTDEFAVRQERSRLATRLRNAGKRVSSISLAECLDEALEAAGAGWDALAEAERSTGLGVTVETVHTIISELQPIDDLVAARIPDDADPLRDVIFVTRAGALFPFYRTSSLLEHLKGRLHVPAVLFYPGSLDGAAGLRFMNRLDADHNYRPRIF